MMECPICKSKDFERIIKPIKSKIIIHKLRRNYYLIDICLGCGADFGVLEYPIKLPTMTMNEINESYAEMESL